MGVLNLVLIALFASGSFAISVPKYDHIKSMVEDDNSFFGGKKWVVLVSGSRGWYNYRHQADICHAYQIIRANGIPEENIITMMVDDIAYNSQNPTPGKIVNRPKGPNVYEGVVIDYKGEDVSSFNFLNILKGNKTGMQNIGSGKVIEGGPHDKVFINFVDHGSTGLLSFPDDYLYADDLNNALKYMFGSASYRKMLLYIEACRAGSMFDGILQDNTNIMAVTASGPRESSYGCYCRAQSEPYGTCLGDLFSVTWMEDLDATILQASSKKRTVFNDFKVVRTNVTLSNVMVYGDFNTGHEKLSAFVGYQEPSGESSTNSETGRRMKKTSESSRNVHENTLHYQMSSERLSKDTTKRHQLSQELRHNNKMRLIIDTVFRNIYSMVVNARPDIKKEIGDLDEPEHLDLTLDVFPCYKSILNKISKICFSLPRNPYSLDRLTIFANLCVVDTQIHQMVSNFIDLACSDIPKNINNVF